MKSSNMKVMKYWILWMIGVLLFGMSLTAATTSADNAIKQEASVTVIFDTDIQGDVDDVGAVAMLHTLVDRGEVNILAMGVSARFPWCIPCLDALNTYFGRPDIPIGVNKGEGFLRRSKYAEQIAAEYPHDLHSADDAPQAATLYRRILAAQEDASVVMISVGQLSNFATLLASRADEFSKLNGHALVRRKVKTWVCMGGAFPTGREANLVHHGSAAKQAINDWPTPIVFSGFEVGVRVLTGGRTGQLPANSPVRRAYQLYNGNQPHKSWDQTAVLYAVRGLDGGLDKLWDLHSSGCCEVDAEGVNRWADDPDCDHAYLVEKAPPDQVARIIDELMMAVPDP